MLAKTKIHLKAQDGDDLVFSPIADFGFFSDRSARDAVNRDAAKATVYIRFNALISQAILSRSWRQINYDRIIGADMYLVRWLRKMLGLRFTYAAPNKSFNIKLSTIIESSGVTLCQRLSDNLKQVEQALSAMPDIVERHAIEKDFTVHVPTGRGRVLADAKIIIRPTHAFAVEQIKTNVHEHRLSEAVLTEDGRVMLEPDRASHPGFLDFEHAKQKYKSGQRLAKPAAKPDRLTP
ncbi:MAG: hypothetical protein ACT4N2_08395 [Hyphomicrobium sp.]